MGQSVESAGASRRTVLKAAAWTAPAVAVVAAAPLAAASPAGRFTINSTFKPGTLVYTDDTVTLRPGLDTPETAFSLLSWTYDVVEQVGDLTPWRPIFEFTDISISVATFADPLGDLPVSPQFDEGTGTIPEGWTEVPSEDPNVRTWHLETTGPMTFTASTGPYADSPLPHGSSEGVKIDLPEVTYPRLVSDAEVRPTHTQIALSCFVSCLNSDEIPNGYQLSGPTAPEYMSLPGPIVQTL